MNPYRTPLPALLLGGLMAMGFAGEAPDAVARFQPQVERFRAAATNAEADLRFTLSKATVQEQAALLHHLARQGKAQDAVIAGWFLDHLDQDVQIAAIVAVGKLGIDSPATVDRLTKLLGHPLPLIRDVTLSAVADLHDDRCLPGLIALLNPSEPALASKALAILRTQTGEKLPADHAAWQNWYTKRADDEQTRYTHALADLATQEPRRMVDGIHSLAGLVTLRSRALAAMAPLAQHPDAMVRTTVDAYLHQLTRTPADQPVSVCLERIQIVVPPNAAPPEPAQVAVAAPAGPSYMRGFLDTWQGLFAILASLSLGLGAMVFFLRTPAGQAVQDATRRFARKTGAVKVVVMIEEGTRRLVKPLAKPIKSVTRRITSDANRAMRKVELTTRRVARSTAKRISASSDDHIALERRKTPA